MHIYYTVASEYCNKYIGMHSLENLNYKISYLKRNLLILKFKFLAKRYIARNYSGLLIVYYVASYHLCTVANCKVELL